MLYLGDCAAGQTLTHRFYTEDPTGAPITLAGSPAVRVRKGTGAGSLITAGITLTVDVVTGQHCVDIDLSASASYAAGFDYALEFSAGTVNGVSVVGKVLGLFSIANRSDSAGVTTLLSRLSATRAGYLDNLSAGAVALASSLTTLAGKFTGITLLAEWLGLIAGKQTGNSTARTELRATGAGSGTYDETTDSQEAARDNMGTAQTGDAFARLGAPAGASVSVDVAAVKTDTASIISTLSGLAAAAATAVWAAGTRLLTAGTNIVLAKGTGVTGFNDPTAGAIADQVWEEPLADHSGTVGSTAEALNAAGAAGDPWATSLPGAYGAGSAGKIVGDNLNATVSSRATQTSVDTIDDFVDTEVAAIKAKTDQLTFTTANKLDARTFTNDDKTGYALTSAYDPAKTASQAGDAMTLTSGERTSVAAAIWNALTSGLSTVSSIGKLLVDNVNATISSRLASAGYTTPPTVAAIADQVWDEALSGHLGAGSTGEQLSNAGAGGVPPTVTAIADEVETRALTLTSSERNSVADALLDRSNAVETGLTVRGSLRLALAALAGKLSGANTSTTTIRNAVADTKDRIIATTDVTGRTAVTTDQT